MEIADHAQKEPMSVFILSTVRGELLSRVLINDAQSFAVRKGKSNMFTGRRRRGEAGKGGARRSSQTTGEFSLAGQVLYFLDRLGLRGPEKRSSISFNGSHTLKRRVSHGDRRTSYRHTTGLGMS